MESSEQKPMNWKGVFAEPEVKQNNQPAKQAEQKPANQDQKDQQKKKRNRPRNRNNKPKKDENEEQKSDVEMKDETKKEEKKPETPAPAKTEQNKDNQKPQENNQNQKKNNNRRRNNNKKLKENKDNPEKADNNQTHQKKNQNAQSSSILVSKEKGFTGGPDKWFDDEEFNKQFTVDLSSQKHDYYFGSYSNFHIHEEMLKDTNRTETYRRAIENNPNDFKDKVVMDIGCGTGILSIFAARAGAKHVYAIEYAEIGLFAREIIKRNGLEDKITVIKGKMEEIELPVKQVDIIISEWMGYFLLYESMLDSVLWARDKYLVKGGKMLPDRAIMHVAAIEDGDYKQNKRNFWNNVYGVDMSCLAPTVMKEPLVDTVNKDMIMSNSCKILELDLVNMDKSEVNFSNQYSLTMNYSDRVHGLVVWFETPFSDLQRPITLSTSPFKTYTHWKQTVLYSEYDLDVKRGDVLSGSIAVRQSKQNFRELDIKVSYHINTPQTKKNFYNLYKLR